MGQLEADMTDMRVTGSQRRTGHNAARFTSTRFSNSNQYNDNRVSVINKYQYQFSSTIGHVILIFIGNFKLCRNLIGCSLLSQ